MLAGQPTRQRPAHPQILAHVLLADRIDLWRAVYALVLLTVIENRQQPGCHTLTAVDEQPELARVIDRQDVSARTSTSAILSELAYGRDTCPDCGHDDCAFLVVVHPAPRRALALALEAEISRVLAQRTQDLRSNVAGHPGGKLAGASFPANPSAAVGDDAQVAGQRTIGQVAASGQFTKAELGLGSLRVRDGAADDAVIDRGTWPAQTPLAGAVHHDDRDMHPALGYSVECPAHRPERDPHLVRDLRGGAQALDAGLEGKLTENCVACVLD
jgi:hypothetical protein